MSKFLVTAPASQQSTCNGMQPGGYPVNLTALDRR